MEQRLWAVSIHGGDAIPLTAEGVSSSHPRWSPTVISRLRSARNGGKNQVWLLDRRGGEAQKLTDVAQVSTISNGPPTALALVLIVQDPKPEDAEAAKDKDKPAPSKPKIHRLSLSTVSNLTGHRRLSRSPPRSPLHFRCRLQK